MKKEILQPTETALVRIQPDWFREPASLVDSQVIGAEATAYLRRNRLDYTRQNLTAAVGVMGDCLQRGLALAGKQTLGPKDNIKTFIREGLEHRGQIRNTLGEAIPQHGLFLLTEDGEYIGPYAFRSSTVKAARSALNRFELAPDIHACDEIAYAYVSRRNLLPRIAGFAIEVLPKDIFPQASLDKFPDASDQAKIACNMITSFLTRGNLSPLFSTDEIVALVRDQPMNSADAFELEPLINPFVQKLQLGTESTAEVRQYLGDLLDQVTFAFQHTPGVPSVDSGIPEEDRRASIDAVDRRLSKVLLLLHPALEEQEIVTDPAKAKEGGLSLWSEGFAVVIDGLRIPDISALHRVMRILKVKKHGVERFERAIQVWKAFDRDQKLEPIKIQRIQTTIKELEEQIRVVETQPDPVIPPWVLPVVQERHSKEYRYFEATRGRLRYYEEKISRARLLRLQADEFIEDLRNKNNGELPESVAVPLWVLYNSPMEGQKMLGKARGDIGHRIEQGIELLQNDFFFKDEHTDFVKQIDTASAGDVEEKALECENMLKVKDFPVRIVSLAQMEDYVEVSLDELQVRISRRGGVSQGVWGRQQDLIKMRRLVAAEYMKGKTSQDRISKETYWQFYRFSLETSVKTLREIAKAKRSFEAFEVNRLPSKELSRDDIEKWRKKVMAATFPFFAVLPDEYREDVASIRDWLDNKKNFGGARWLNPIPSKDGFAQWIDDNTLALQNKTDMFLADKPHRKNFILHEIQKIDRRVAFLQQTRSVLPSPLIPEAEGLSSADFWHCVRQRLDLVRALMEVDQTRAEVVQRTSEIEALKKDTYAVSLYDKKNRASSELEQISRNSPAKTRFIERMKALNLSAG